MTLVSFPTKEMITELVDNVLLDKELGASLGPPDVATQGYDILPVPVEKPKRVRKPRAKKVPLAPLSEEGLITGIFLKDVKRLIDDMGDGYSCYTKLISTDKTMALFRKFLGEELTGVLDDATEIALCRTFPEIIGLSGFSEESEDESHEYEFKDHCPTCEVYWTDSHNLNDCIAENYVVYCDLHKLHAAFDCGWSCVMHPDKPQATEPPLDYFYGKENAYAPLKWNAIKAGALTAALPKVYLIPATVPFEINPYNPKLADKFDLPFKDFKAIVEANKGPGDNCKLTTLYPNYTSSWTGVSGNSWDNWVGTHHMVKLDEKAPLPDEFDLEYQDYLKMGGDKNGVSLLTLFPDYNSTWKGQGTYPKFSGPFHLVKKGVKNSAKIKSYKELTQTKTPVATLFPGSQKPGESFNLPWSTFDKMRTAAGIHSINDLYPDYSYESHTKPGGTALDGGPGWTGHFTMTKKEPSEFFIKNEAVIERLRAAKGKDWGTIYDLWPSCDYETTFNPLGYKITEAK